MEAQTLTVWRQADRYEVPRIIFLNKMDKVGADFKNCLNHIKTKLKCEPLEIQLPIGTGKTFRGIVDLVNLSVKSWDCDSLGTSFSTKYVKLKIPKFHYTITSILSLTRKLDSSTDCDILNEALQKRNELIDKLSGLDDVLANLIIERDSLEGISVSELNGALRRITLARVC